MSAVIVTLIKSRRGSIMPSKTRDSIRNWENRKDNFRKRIHQDHYTKYENAQIIAKKWMKSRKQFCHPAHSLIHELNKSLTHAHL